MPRNDQLRKILLIGSGPIIIGRGCEFNYSGVQACKALHEEGYQVGLVNSNPATIMADPEFAVRTCIEPITPGVIQASWGAKSRTRFSRRWRLDRPQRS